MKIVLAPIEPEEIEIIREWETYPPEFAELDYALRTGGWIDEFYTDPLTRIFTAKSAHEIIGFSLLSTQDAETEFRIAIKPDKISKGFGKIVTQATLSEFYKNNGTHRLYLIVRFTNTIAQKLYEKVGFVPDKEITKDIREIPVRFLKMIHEG